jgi:hypothetical protein
MPVWFGQQEHRPSGHVVLQVLDSLCIDKQHNRDLGAVRPLATSRHLHSNHTLPKLLDELVLDRTRVLKSPIRASNPRNTQN